MKYIHCKTWSAAKKAIDKIQKHHAYYSDGIVAGKNKILFRGHADASWKLETTLERFMPLFEWYLSGYIDTAISCANRVNSIFGQSWNITPKEEIASFCKTPNIQYSTIPMLNFLIYLRHHGFPSFLLDWSLSPWIAAFFSIQEKTNAEYISIICMCENLPTTKHLCNPKRKVSVHTITPDLTTHKRNFLQQSVYTYCLSWDQQEKAQQITRHEGALPSNSLWKIYNITIPSSERATIQHELSEMNITHYTLFHSEDSLIRTLAEEYLNNEYDDLRLDHLFTQQDAYIDTNKA